MTSRTREMVLRIALIGGSVYVLSFFVYGKLIFDPTMSPSAYGVNAVTLGISYAMFTARRFRDGFTMLLVWYIVVTGLFFHRHTGWWNFLMEAHYIIGLAGTAALYVYVIEKKLPLHHWVQRVILWTLLCGITHGIIVILMQIITARFFSHLPLVASYSYHNLRSGIMVGLISGLGLELSEYLLRKMKEKRGENTDASEPTLHLT